MFESMMLDYWSRTTPPEFEDMLVIERAGVAWYLIAATRGGTAIDLPWTSLMYGHPIVTTTHDEANLPVPEPSSLIQRSSHWLHINETPGWQALFGEYQIGTILPHDAPVWGALEFPVNTPLGPKIIYPSHRAWDNTSWRYRHLVGFWSQPDRNGPCGGNGRVGPSPHCSFFASSVTTAHVDRTTAKYLYINAPT